MEVALDNLGPEPIGRPALDPEAHFFSGIGLRAISDAIECLPRDQRDILLDQAVEGLSYRELARRHGTTLEGVRSRLLRVRAKARRVYASIAEARGLSVVCGLVVGVRRKVRDFRYQVASFPDSLSAAVSSSPAAANAIAAVAVAGAVGVLAPLGGPGAEQSPSLTPVEEPSIVEVSWRQPSSELLSLNAEDADDPPAEGSLPPSSEVESPNSQMAADVGRPEGGTSVEASVDSSDAVPADQPPASSTGGAKLEHGDGGTQATAGQEVDSDNDGEANVWAEVPVSVPCPSPEDRTTLTGVSCALHEATNEEGTTEGD